MVWRLSANKKAQGESPDMIFVILQLIVIGIAIATIMNFIIHHSSQTTFEKNWMSKDGATRVDVAYIAPDDLVLNYKIKNMPYDFSALFESKKEIKKDGKTEEIKFTRVIIKREGQEEGKDDAIAWYPFAKNEIEPELATEALNPEKGIIIAKINNKLSIGPDKNILELKCADVDTENDPKKVLIDAGHSADKGFKHKDVTDTPKEGLIEGNIVGDISKSLMANLLAFEVPVIVLTPIGVGPFKETGTTLDGPIRRRTDDEIEQQIITETPSIIISLHVGSYNSPTNNVKAYYSIKSAGDIKMKNEKLACLILNKISELNKAQDIKIDGTAIIPIHKEDYENAVLPDDKVAVLLEIGNIQSLSGQKMLNLASGKIASAIQEGVVEYFKEQAKNDETTT